MMDTTEQMLPESLEYKKSTPVRENRASSAETQAQDAMGKRVFHAVNTPFLFKTFKAQVIQECAQPGASIASIALGHSLNENLVHNGFGCTRR
jgi:hypothetical protein